ncbi:Uncharacterised protein [Mycobacteroides abscessus]|nr:Uncharacterised protein [Mycobacteroides abscessus]
MICGYAWASTRARRKRPAYSSASAPRSVPSCAFAWSVGIHRSTTTGYCAESWTS